MGDETYGTGRIMRIRETETDRHIKHTNIIERVVTGLWSIVLCRS